MAEELLKKNNYDSVEAYLLKRKSDFKTLIDSNSLTDYCAIIDRLPDQLDLFKEN